MRFRDWVNEDFVGKGNNGIVFTNNNDDVVVKITSNENEAKLATWLKNHQHPNIAKINSVTKAKNGWKIVVEKVNTNFPSSKHIEDLRNRAQKENYNSPKDIANYLEKHFSDEKYISEIVSVLRHIIKSEMKLKDFLNPNNMGLKNGIIKLFDLQ